ncbi:MAG: alginate export family protein [Candidatus Hydrogenedentes bacterium]|nr:alginate export family protein [Candidatus Hydrogenedentota bacterium]
MRKITVIVAAACLLISSGLAYAELQNVVVGGKIRIRGNYYASDYTGPAAAEVRWPAGLLPGRPIGGPFNALGAVSFSDWDDDGNDAKYIEQRTLLNVRADFTDNVSAFIELDSYDLWGEDFRSNYITGNDLRAAGVANPFTAGGTTDDVEVFQSYIEANEMWGYPLRLRIGRQVLSFGSEWLVGSEENATGFFGTSFDAIRLTYATDQFSVDAWASKLAERSPIEEDGDVDFYGIYGSYKGIENLTLDAYWMFVRDAISLNDTNFVWPVEWVEDIIGVDDYDPTELHTVGLRAAGTFGAFDYDAEVAYQFGDADAIGSTFVPFAYGDDDADFDAFAANLSIGYTFDMTYSPRLWLIAAYFEGEDNRDLSFWDWLNPFDRPQASVSFNRLFSTWEYSEFVVISDESNFYTVDVGVTFHPTEQLDVMVHAASFWAVEPFDAPVSFKVGKFRIPIAPALSFWTEENDDYLWTEAGIYPTYRYSEDLTFSVGWCHVFTGNGLEEGSFNAFNGLAFNGGSDDDDSDYFFFETVLKF